MKNNHLTWHQTAISKQERHILNNHKSCVLWFTGLSGSGKSTLANAVDQALFNRRMRSYVLDGDNVRHGLNKDLGFTKEDRKENIRRIGEVARLFVDSGLIVSVAFISPFKKDRELVRSLFERNEFIEIFVRCPLELCAKRDPKGLYRKAHAGEITSFTGISAPYENPENPEIIIDTNKNTIANSVKKILRYLENENILS